MKRVYLEKIDIDSNSILEFYKERAINKVKIDIDSPVVLCGDKDKNNIKIWTDFEVNNRLKLLNIDSDSIVLEMGCGTGRISKYIIENSKRYVGVDYVKELIDIAQSRNYNNKEVIFINNSFLDFVNNNSLKYEKFNRFVISGGVFMYMNDYEVSLCIEKLLDFLDYECILYISEPIAIMERLTLNKFYSETLNSEYSAIYRTVDEYKNLFNIFFKQGFKLDINELFFYDDIKKQKETKQWLFLLSRGK